MSDLKPRHPGCFDCLSFNRDCGKHEETPPEAEVESGEPRASELAKTLTPEQMENIQRFEERLKALKAGDPFTPIGNFPTRAIPAWFTERVVPRYKIPGDRGAVVWHLYQYRANGWRIIPIPPVDGKPVKGPRVKDWEKLRLTIGDIPQHFMARNTNLGVILGDASDGLADVDIDALNIDRRTAQLAHRLVPRYLPPTLIFGRKSNPSSHRLYRSPGAVSEKFYDLGEYRSKHIIELRANQPTGGAFQTVLPPSIHEGTGEPITWEPNGYVLLDIAPGDLRRRIEIAVAAILLAKYYPAEHNRNLPNHYLSGAMAKAGWKREEALQFLEPIWDAVSDPKKRDRVSEVNHTYDMFEKGEDVAGFSKLKEVLSAELADRLAASLAIQPEEDEHIEIRDWPEPPAPEAFAGLAGEFVKLWEPHTEADTVALLGQFLTFFGHAVGRNPFFAVGGDDHHTNLFTTLLGATSYARKGQSYGCVQRTFELTQPFDLQPTVNLASGLSSGEGLISAVRDPVEGHDKKGNQTVVDHGAIDKRMQVFESEFASVLRRMTREGNTLSEVLRQAWDGGRLGTMTRTAPLHATGVHVSLITHVTRADLALYLNDVSAVNGFANRFLFLATRRAKLLADPGRPCGEALSAFAKKLSPAIAFGATVKEMRRSPDAAAVWEELYKRLNEPRVGRLHGAVVARGPAQVVRLSMIYALLDQSAVIEARHLVSAAALWDYAERSSKYVFGDSLGDRLADQILGLLREAGDSGLLTREIRERVYQKKRVPEALRLLADDQRIRYEKGRRGDAKGRAGQRWFTCR